MLRKPKKYRGREEIISAILSLLEKEGRVSKTKIKKEVGLSSFMINRYLNYLLALDLIKEVALVHPKNERKFSTYYKLTDKGKIALKRLQEVKKLMREI